MMPVNDLIKRTFGFASLIGFALVFSVHIAALMGIDVGERFPAVWALHGGVFIVFVPFVFSSKELLGPKPTFAQIRAAFPPGLS